MPHLGQETEVLWDGSSRTRLGKAMKAQLTQGLTLAEQGRQLCLTPAEMGLWFRNPELPLSIPTVSSPKRCKRCPDVSQAGNRLTILASWGQGWGLAREGHLPKRGRKLGGPGDEGPALSGN